MKKFIAVTAAVATLAVFLCSCATAPASRRTIRLRGNDTQGYTWEYLAENEEIISEVERDYKDGNLAGTNDAPGIYLFTFEGANPGNTRVYFHYVEKGDLTGDNPLSTVVYNVTVGEDGNIIDCTPIGTFEEVEGVGKLQEVREILKSKSD